MHVRASLVVVAVCVVGCAGPAGPAGAEGPTGPAGATGQTGPSGAQPPSISSVSPLRLFIGRSQEVTVSGSDTKWTSAATIDFGAGITVDSVTTASPTGLVAKISVAQTAALGARTVTVTEGSDVARYVGAVHVDSPLSVSTVGTMAQGSILNTHIEMLDVTTPFDVTREGDGTFSPITYPRIQVAVPDGGVLLSMDVSATGLELVIGLNTQMPTSAAPLSVLSGPPGSVTTSVSPVALNPAARSGTPLVVGTPAIATTTGFNESQLYAVAGPTVATLFEVRLSTSVVDEQRGAILLPANGSWANLRALGSTIKPLVWASPAQTSWNVVTTDNNAFGMYTTNLIATPMSASAGENPASTSIASAQIVSALPFVMFNGTLTGTSYQHWLKVPVLAGDVGKKLRVRTLAGDIRADPQLDIFLPDGTTLFAQSDDGAHENLLTPVLSAAGDYVVKVTLSSTVTTDTFDPTQTHFDLYVATE
ncbi:MAG: hypothetical protein QM817_40470 [Archangium sp.]